MSTRPAHVEPETPICAECRRWQRAYALENERANQYAASVALLSDELIMAHQRIRELEAGR